VGTDRAGHANGEARDQHSTLYIDLISYLSLAFLLLGAVPMPPLMKSSDLL
jgi:hypothetical protein